VPKSQPPDRDEFDVELHWRELPADVRDARGRPDPRPLEQPFGGAGSRLLLRRSGSVVGASSGAGGWLPLVGRASAPTPFPESAAATRESASARKARYWSTPRDNVSDREVGVTTSEGFDRAIEASHRALDQIVRGDPSAFFDLFCRTATSTSAADSAALVACPRADSSRRWLTTRITIASPRSRSSGTSRAARVVRAVAARPSASGRSRAARRGVTTADGISTACKLTAPFEPPRGRPARPQRSAEKSVPASRARSPQAAPRPRRPSRGLAPQRPRVGGRSRSVVLSGSSASSFVGPCGR
jgi:hypothetical protein